MSKVRHVLGISGGKDSAALAIYMRHLYPELAIEYYSCDTGRELEETYELIRRIEIALGKPILHLVSEEIMSTGVASPFDYFLELYGGYLPSQNSRWCTKKLKLDPFEKYVGTEPVISYVGIRGDEDRDGYISKKTNIQAIFPFRRNIWSEDVVRLFLGNTHLPRLFEHYKPFVSPDQWERLEPILTRPLSEDYSQKQKLNALLDISTKLFNHAIFSFLKTTDYPVGRLDSFPLLDNDDSLNKQDIFNILDSSGVGIPAYYNPIEFEIKGKKGAYSRSRSGCFFCFYQQKIEWIWLLEQHPDLYWKAAEYEKDGYSWSQDETLRELAQPERVTQIKLDYIKRVEREKKTCNTPLSWQDAILNADGAGCASCFV